MGLLLADSAFLRTALGRRQTVTFGASAVPILTLEDLILLKMLAGRLQDRADLEKIEARKAELSVDWAYVEGWKSKLGLGDKYNRQSVGMMAMVESVATRSRERRRAGVAGVMAARSTTGLARLGE